MRGRTKDIEHLIRAAVIVVIGVIVLLIARGFLLPEGFGRYGHYRPGALDDIRARAPVFAGRAACAECHDDIVQARQGSKHEGIGCEACHGALAAHAENPTEVTPTLPDAATLCARCHERNVARPASFPQVDPAEHSGGEVCTSCHQPHHPEIE